MDTKNKIGTRVAVFGPHDPKGKGEVIDGPDEQGNYLIRWDEPWDGDGKPTWEAIDESDVA